MVNYREWEVVCVPEDIRCWALVTGTELNTTPTGKRARTREWSDDQIETAIRRVVGRELRRIRQGEDDATTVVVLANDLYDANES